ncbi:hypothetical protein [Ramlibacter sp.]|uniref:hypothetical protein n=1 Tax=Ramlibacter sp. TaxID=1917967 RepID=UPI002CBB9895|nr:hypothetical protein [Ramlibacter sp.]HWI82632.1 hypothetical protein [Ramlibacter sp.]
MHQPRLPGSRRLRALWLMAAASAALLLSACSPDDAAAARVAAGALKSRVNIALAAHSDLLVRALFEEPDSDERLIAGEVGQAFKDRTAAGWRADQQKIRSRFSRRDPRAAARSQFAAETKPVADAMNDIEAAAVSFEQAWPFGAEHFVCLKQGVFALTSHLRRAAISFDQNPAGSGRYVQLRVPAQVALDRYEVAVRAGKEIDAATSLQGFRQLLREEEQANEAVQAGYVQAAQAAAELYQAIEATERVSLVDALKLVQRYAPMLSGLDPSFDGDAIARKAGVTLGKVGSSEWLARFASQPVPGADIKCKTAI